jgi:16S rRNA (guanine527-N7)-methyltransferase
VPDTDEGGASAVNLREVLLAARDAGFLGPGPVDRHLLHARGFVDVARAQISTTLTPRILDLGSGGGLPGLVIADQWSTATLVLLEANQRRAQFLERAVIRCHFQDRVTVVQERAEISGHEPGFRGAFDGVVVRSFGSPAVVAECAAPLLRAGGWLIVSEPPGDGSSDSEPSAPSDEPGRWPREKLTQFGLEPTEFVRSEFGYQVLIQRELCPDRFPRRNGMPSKKPLF